MINEKSLLERTKEIVIRGGHISNYPCPHGVFCLRCCISEAKDEFDKEDWSQSSDPAPLIAARNLISCRGDDGIKHTQESALALLTLAIEDCS